MMRKFLMSLALVGSVSMGTMAKTPNLYAGTDRAAMNKWVDSVYNALTPDERVGQIIAQVFAAKDLNATKAELKRVIEKYHVGGVYFSIGPALNHAEFANYANSLSKVPIMVCIDGEWGLSMRMPETPRFPKNMALGAIQDDQLLYEYGREMARECHEVGVNVNFAPAVDVNSNPANPVIGQRSYGEDPINVSRKAIAYARGLEDNGILSVAKHFPGHGDTREDSHKTLPTVNRPLASLKTIDLLPFTNYVNAGLGGVMVAHLNVPALSKSKYPTSLNHAVVTDFLKNDMQFEGLVFTDGLQMLGARIPGKANGVLALKAGVDVMIEPHNLPMNVEQLRAMYKKGGQDSALIANACKKMLSYKYILGLTEKRMVDKNGLLNRINSPEAKALVDRLYAASMTVVKNDNRILPIKHLENRVSVVTVGGSRDKVSDFVATCKLFAPVDAHQMTASTMSATVRDVKGAGTVVVGIYDKSSASRNAVNYLVRHIDPSRLVLCFFVRPYDMSAYASAIKKCAGVIEAYEDEPGAQKAAAQVAFGGINATGKLPVSVEGVAKCGHGINLYASRLGYASPEDVGLDRRMVEQIDSIASLAIREKAFPGCQVLVARNGKVVLNKSYGYLDYTNKLLVNNNTLYDLASVSKASGMLSGVMKAVEQGKLSLDGRLDSYIPSLKGNEKGGLTIRDLLYHETGMQPSLNMYTLMTDTASYKGALVTGSKSADYPMFAGGGYINRTAKVRSDITSSVKTKDFDVQIGKHLYVGDVTRDTIMNIIHNLPLRSDRNFVYSCLNFCLLREAEEAATGVRHDRYVYDNIFHRIGSFRTVYRPLEHFSAREIAPTELDDYFRGGMVQGVVHDETAAFSGGIQGNAGLFSNANDLAKLCQMWLNGGTYGGEQILSADVVKTFMTSVSPNSHRGLGFDKPNFDDPENSSVCEQAGKQVVGHTGFTGTSFWIDPEENLIYVFLCNRVCPSRINPAFANVGARYNIFGYIYDSIARNKK